MDKIVSGLVRTALHRSLSVQASDKDVDMTTKALVEKINKMPVVLKTAMTVLTYVFGLVGNFNQWKKSPIGVLGSFTDFYEKMSVFIYFSLCQNKS
jgi:hypothetical protein